MQWRTYLPSLAFDSTVEPSNEPHESKALRNDTELPSIMTVLGLLPHCSQQNPSERSMSSSVMKEYHPILKWWYWKPAACRDCSVASQWITLSTVYSVCIVVLLEMCMSLWKKVSTSHSTITCIPSMEERKHVSAHNLIGYATCLHIDDTLFLTIKVQVCSATFISALSVIYCIPQTQKEVLNKNTVVVL